MSEQPANSEAQFDTDDLAMVLKDAKDRGMNLREYFSFMAHFAHIHLTTYDTGGEIAVVKRTKNDTFEITGLLRLSQNFVPAKPHQVDAVLEALETIEEPHNSYIQAFLDKITALPSQQP